MESLQQAVSWSRAAVAPVAASAAVAAGNASATRSIARVSLVKKYFLSGTGVAFVGNNAKLIALAQKSPVSSTSSSSKGVVVMKADSAAGGYAKALAELAQESNDLEKANKDMESLSELLNNKELYEFLVSPVVEEEKKKSILKTLAEDAQFSDNTLSFLNILVEKKRIGLIKDVTKEFESIYNDISETQVATVTSAVKIEKPQLALIAKKIQSLSGAKNVRIKNVVDPSLIAGFLVKYGQDGSRFIDMSVKGQLDRLAAQFENAEKVGAF